MKKIRKTKILNEQDAWKVILRANDLARNVSMAIERRIRIVQLDECVVSKLTVPAYAWTNKKTNILYDLSRI